MKYEYLIYFFLQLHSGRAYMCLQINLIQLSHAMHTGTHTGTTRKRFLDKKTTATSQTLEFMAFSVSTFGIFRDSC